MENFKKIIILLIRREIFCKIEIDLLHQICAREYKLILILKI